MDVKKRIQEAEYILHKQEANKMLFKKLYGNHTFSALLTFLYMKNLSQKRTETLVTIAFIYLFNDHKPNYT